MSTKMKWIAYAAVIMVTAALQVPAAGTIVPPEKIAPNSTFCTPLNLDYCFRPDRGTGREAADPLIVPFKGDYYLFPSKSAGYWCSPDLVNWKLVPSGDNYNYVGDGEHVPVGQPEKDLPVWGYGPLAAVVDGALIYSQQCDAFYRFIDPQQGTFERVRDRLPVSNDDWIFTDTYLGDLPQYGVGHRQTGPDGNLVGWMLLSYKKQATASSVLPDHPLEPRLRREHQDLVECEDRRQGRMAGGGSWQALPHQCRAGELCGTGRDGPAKTPPRR